MLKPSRIFFGLAAFLVLLAFVPLPVSATIRGAIYSVLKEPLGCSRDGAGFIRDLFSFQKNAAECRRLRNMIAGIRREQFESREILLENERLTKLLEARRVFPKAGLKSFISRVIGRSPAAWHRVLLIDKGTRQGIRVNMPVLCETSLVGKIAEAGPRVSQVLLITDPGCKIGVMTQRTREHGVLYGTLSQGCRMKYIELEADVKAGDLVETAGHGGFIPKGLLVGKITRVWKEPGQMYQVAEVRPWADLGRIEEVICLES